MKRNLFHIIVALLFLSFPTGFTPLLKAQNFNHPGVPFTQEDLDQLKENITREPWKSHYTSMMYDWRSATGYGMQGPREVVSRTPDVNLTQWRNDMVAIHNQAFMWVFTGNPQHAKKGIFVLNEWAKNHRVFSGEENFLDLGDYAHYLFTGADILKHTTPAGLWTDEVDRNVKTYFEQVLWPVADVPYPVRGHNQGAIQLKVAIGLAAFLGDQEKWEQAVDVFFNDAGGGLTNSLANGQVGDTGRDWGHWHGQVDALAWCAEVIYKQGIDAFEFLDKRMLAISELYSKHKLGNTDDIYIPHGGTYACYGTFGGGADGRTNKFLGNIIEAAYTLRKGIDAPYTKALNNVSGDDGLTFLYRKEVDNFRATTIPKPNQFPQPGKVINMTSVDVGDVCLAGSSGYKDGVWILKGAGKDIPVPPMDQPDAFHYAFREIKGNGAIITKMTALERDSRAGLMFRTGLEADDKYAGIFYDGGTNFTFRGADGWSKTATSWNNAPGGFLSHWCPSLPYWFKLERYNDKIYGYHSPDGENWTCLGIAAFDNLQSSLYVGLCMTSKNTSLIKEAKFENVSISGIAPEGAPVITSETRAQAAITVAFNYEIKATNNPASYDATGLPQGLTINKSTGVISGTPTNTGRFFITLTSKNSVGEDTAILILDVTNNVAPLAPGGLTLSETSPYQVTLSWESVANVSSYTVKRSDKTGGPYTTIAEEALGNQYLDLDPYPGNNYYIVIANAGIMSSSPSEEQLIVLPPAIPSRPAVTTTSSTVTLTWEPAGGATSYNVKRSETPGGPYTTIETALSATTYTDNTVTNGNYYYYVITSVYADKESQPSPEELGVPGITTYTWSTTPVSDLWSEPRNWQGGVAPTNPAILIFGTTNELGEDNRKSVRNDIQGLDIARITFREGAPEYIITGEEIEIKNGIYNQSGSWQNVNLPLKLAFMIEADVTGGGMAMNEKISGPGGIIKRGFNTLSIHYGENTYSGGTVIYDCPGGWGPVGTINISGSGTETGEEVIISDDEIQLKTILSGPLGTGTITMSGGGILNERWTRLYNEIHFTEGTRSYLYNNFETFDIDGKFTGKGEVETDGNHAQGGIAIWADNREFEGTYINVKRSSWTRTRFERTRSISPKAKYELRANFSDSHRFIDTTTPYRFGELSGEGLLRTWTDPTFEVGYLNTDSEFSGSTVGGIKLVKVGTGKFTLTGQMYFENITIKEGKLYVTGAGIVDAQRITVENGATLGGNGSGTAPIFINSGGKFTPGDDNVGTYLAKSAVTFQDGANFEIELEGDKSDQLIANGVHINGDAILNISIISTPTATEYMIIENTSSSPVTGTFQGLDEFDIIQIDSRQYRITYQGGDGNDIVLIDNNSISNTAPIAPKNLAGESPESRKIQLTWETLPASEYGATYSIERADVSGGPYTLIASGLTTTEFLDDKDLTAETTYYYRVFATNYFGEGDRSAELAVTTLALSIPDAPANVIADAGFNQVNLYWRTTWEAYSYEIKRADQPGGPYESIANNVADTLYTDLTVQNGNQYYYVVLSENPLYKSEPSAEVTATPTENAWSYYAMNQKEGTNIVDSWNNRHGVLMGTGNWVEGVMQEALKLDGSADSYIKLPDGSINTLTDFTISTWIKMESYGGWARVWDFGRGTDHYLFLATNAGDPNADVRFAIKNGSAEQSIVSSYVIPYGKWVHLTVAKNGNTVIMYANGDEIGRNENVTINPTQLGHLTQNYIGKSQWPDAMLNGTIDDFRIYDRGLSQSEIVDIITMVAPDAPRNLVVSRSTFGVTLEWDAIENATYTLRRSLSPDGPFELYDQDIELSSYTDYSANYGTYYYKVSATVNHLEGPSSEKVSIILPPATPTRGIALGWNKRVDLIWDASVGAEKYVISRSTVSGGPYMEIEQTISPAFVDNIDLINEVPYYYIIKAVNEGGESETSEELTATPVEKAGFDDWKHTDVGNTVLTGNAGFEDDKLTLYGAGGWIYQNSDGFHYAYTQVEGDVAIVAKVLGMTHTDNNAKAGVMIREQLTPNSATALSSVRPDNQWEIVYRLAENFNTEHPMEASYEIPQWVKMTRTGNEFKGYISPDGINWHEHEDGTRTIDMTTEPVYVGVFALSHNTSLLTKTEYSHVTVSTALPEIGGNLNLKAVCEANFEYNIVATNAPYLYQAENLPKGLILNPDNGKISGTPEESGIVEVTLNVYNAMGSATATLTIEIAPAPVNILTPESDSTDWIAYAQKGYIHVLTSDSDPIREIKVYSPNGTIIYYQAEINAASYQSSSAFDAGMYVVQVTTDNGVKSKKIIINR